MQHPLARLAPPERARWFRRFLVFTFAVQAFLIVTGLPLKTGAAPAGIVSYELAKTANAAQAILDSWKDARGAASLNLWADYLFMIAYSTTIALACLWTRDALDKAGWPMPAIGAPLAWAQWLAALLDAIENAGLIYFLYAPPTDGLAYGVWACASLKFAIVGLGLLYAAYGLAARLLERKPKPA